MQMTNLRIKLSEETGRQRDRYLAIMARSIYKLRDLRALTIYESNKKQITYRHEEAVSNWPYRAFTAD